MNQAIILALTIIAILFSPVSFAATKELNWVGCGISKKAYMTDLADAFALEKGIKINIQGGGATKGIREVAAGNSDLGGSCRFHLPDSDQEMAVGFEPVAWDALVVIVHKDNPVSNINLTQVRDLLLGKITNWSQLGGPSAPVKLYVRKGKISGVGYTIRKLVFANNNQEFVASKEFDSTGPLEKAVEEDPLAIAISGISSAQQRNVKMLSLNQRTPDYDNIKSGQYVLYRPLFITFNPASPNIDEIREFIKFAHSTTGRRIMKKNGVVPYLEALRLVMKQVEQDKRAQKLSNQELTYE